MARKPSTASKADSPAAKQKTARKPKSAPKTDGEAKHPGGRPSKYKPEYCEQARKLAEAGFTDLEMADFFKVAKTTFYRWSATYPEFRNSIKVAKEGPDDRMEQSLYHRGTGFEWIEQQAFKLKEVKYVDGHKTELERIEVVDVRRCVPPDSTAAIFWLKNRRGWKDKSEVDHGLSSDLLAMLGEVDGDSASII